MSRSTTKTVPQANVPSFLETQHQFTTYIRNPESAPAPNDVELRRMKIYRDLFFNNISNFLADNFPVLKAITPENQWQDMAHDFFARHPSRTPYFAEIAQEFIGYIQNERAQNPQAKHDFPFLLELAHYEWVELVISIAEDKQQTNPTEHLNIANAKLSLANTALALAYQYPVHQISPDFIPLETPEQPTFLVVYREQDDKVSFLETNASTHQLISNISENDSNKKLTAHALLENMATAMQHPKPEIVIQGGLEVMTDLITRGILTAY